MTAIENAKAHFTSFGVQKLEVPEWGESAEKPLVVYWKPITLAERQKLQSIGERDGYVARLADCVIMKALDGAGKPIFTIEHKHALRHLVDPDVIARIVTRMMAAPTAGELGNG